jgi:hypothetical protein
MKPHCFCDFDARRKNESFFGSPRGGSPNPGGQKKPFRPKRRARATLFFPFGAEKYRKRRKGRNRRFTSTGARYSGSRGVRKGRPGAPGIAQQGPRDAPKPLRGRFRKFRHGGDFCENAEKRPEAKNKKKDRKQSAGSRRTAGYYGLAEAAGEVRRGTLRVRLDFRIPGWIPGWV